MPIAPSRACEWCMGSTWCHLSGFYGLEELTNLRYIHIIYNLNCPESQLLAAPYLGKKELCGTEDAQPCSGLWSCCGTPGAVAVSLILKFALQARRRKPFYSATIAKGFDF